MGWGRACALPRGDPSGRLVVPEDPSLALLEHGLDRPAKLVQRNRLEGDHLVPARGMEGPGDALARAGGAELQELDPGQDDRHVQNVVVVLDPVDDRNDDIVDVGQDVVLGPGPVGARLADRAARLHVVREALAVDEDVAVGLALGASAEVGALVDPAALGPVTDPNLDALRAHVVALGGRALRALGHIPSVHRALERGQRVLGEALFLREHDRILLGPTAFPVCDPEGLSCPIG